jgi:hypothetical protein
MWIQKSTCPIRLLRIFTRKLILADFCNKALVSESRKAASVHQISHDF